MIIKTPALAGQIAEKRFRSLGLRNRFTVFFRGMKLTGYSLLHSRKIRISITLAATDMPISATGCA